MKKRAVFLDRDGVINSMIFKRGKMRAPDDLAGFSFLEGVPDAVRLLQDAGYLTIVATNQPDVARGWQKKEIVDEINAHVVKSLGLTDLKVCFHDEGDGCACRKPEPGMLLEAAREWDVDLSKSYMIGDRFSDVKAGLAAGCRTVLIGDGGEGESVEPHAKASSLLEATRLVLSGKV